MIPVAERETLATANVPVLAPRHVFAACFAPYLVCGMCLSGPGAIPYDTIFDLDTSRMLENFTALDAGHGYDGRHPLVPFLIQPLMFIIMLVLPDASMGAAALMAAVGAGTVAMFYAMLIRLVRRHSVRLAFTGVFAASYATLVSASAPETFALSGFLFVATATFALSTADAPYEDDNRNLVCLALLGILCVSITATNVLTYAIVLTWWLASRVDTLRSAKRGAAVAACLAATLVTVCVIEFVLCIVQGFVWQNYSFAPAYLAAQLFDPDIHRDTMFLDHGFDAAAMTQWVSSCMLQPLVSPSLTVGMEPPRMEGSRSSDIEFGAYGPAGGAVLALLFACLLVAFVICLRDRNKLQADRPWRIVAVLAVIALVDLALHYIYNRRYAFIYAPHYLWAMLAFAAMLTDRACLAGARSGVARALPGLVGATAAAMLVVNLASFADVCGRVCALTGHAADLHVVALVAARCAAVVLIALIAHARMRERPCGPSCPSRRFGIPLGIWLAGCTAYLCAQLAATI